MKRLVKLIKPTKLLLVLVVGIVILGVVFTALNRPKSYQSSMPDMAMMGTMTQKFNYLSTHGNSNCSDKFYQSISSMSDSQMIQGSCCSKMDLSKYEKQVAGLKKYASISQIPPDPYNVPASLAKQALVYNQTITLTVDEQKILDEGVANSPEKGYCCCKCWRWHVYEGISEYLVRNQHFTAQQITDVLTNSDGCGGGDA